MNLRTIIKEVIKEVSTKKLYYLDSIMIDDTNEVIYSICSSDGHYENLLKVKYRDVISDTEGTDDGVFVLELK